MNSIPDWPVTAAALAAASEFMRQAAKASTVSIACDKDVDGLTSGTIVHRTLSKLGAKNVHIFPARKGEHAHSDAFRQRLMESKPDVLIVTDMGARGGTILAGVPTLIVDHHQPKGYPEGALILSAYQATPIPSSSVVAYLLAEQVCDASDLEWLAVLGAIADLADDVPYPDIAAVKKRCGSKNVTESIALLNAARRSASDAVDVALRVLQAAQSPRDIATSDSDDVRILRECRAEVSAALKQLFKLAPKFSKTLKVALLRFSSPAQIHPLLATRWSSTLKKYAVMAANDGYMPGRVVFSTRTNSDMNLIELLVNAAPELSSEFGYGHKQATGGNLSTEHFAVLLQRLGFETL